MSLSSDPSLFESPQTVDAFVAGRACRSRAARAERATRSSAYRSSVAGRRASSASAWPRRPCPQRCCPDSTDRRELGAHFNVFDYRPRIVRIAFDVSPLSPPAARDRELHPRVARWSRRGRGRRARDRRVRAHQPPRAGADPGGARRASTSSSEPGACRSPMRCGRPGAAPGAQPRSGSSAPSTCCTSPTGCSRHNAPECGRRRSTTSCRCTIPSGRLRARDRCTRASTGTRPKRATSCS